MKLAKFLFLLLVLGLLGLLLQRSELGAVFDAVRSVGWTGLLALLALYAANYVTDVWSWQLTPYAAIRLHRGSSSFHHGPVL